MNIDQYWKDVLDQDAAAIRSWFDPDAYINWHNTNEQFSVEEFIQVNCIYPGKWSGDIEQLIQTEKNIISAVHVYSQDNCHHYHVTSFIEIKDNRIIAIDEYWGDDGTPPQWRQQLNIGHHIR